MKLAVWLLLLATITAAGYTFWKWRLRWLERKRAAEERFTSFIAGARPAPPAAEAPRPEAARPEAARPAGFDNGLQKLLFEAAAKAGEAGEPALSIQLYARLLARYPDSAFGAQARAAVEVQKQRLGKP